MRKFLTQLTLCFALIVLLTVALIAIFANIFLVKNFDSYLTNQQLEYEQNLASGLTLQYDDETEEWNVEYIHGMGMYALEDYYIIKVYDKNGSVVWDAENHDMQSCHNVMQGLLDEITRLKTQNPQSFFTTQYPLLRAGVQIGTAEITHFVSNGLSESDQQFINSLNVILVVVGVLSLVVAVVVSVFLANKISKPITQLAKVTKEISRGNYTIRCDDTTKTQEIYQLTDSVNHMTDEIEKQEKLRQRLTSDVAHELRTPLAIAASYLEAMSEGVWEPTPERLRSCQEEIDRITNIVSELEKIRQIESENLNLNRTDFDFKEIVESVTSLFDIKMSEKKLSCITGNDKMIVNADERKIRQVLLNLISNAVKYSYEGGKIEIGWQEYDTEWKFYVKDTGIGFPQEQADLLFERFYRTDVSRSRGTGGVGIGLSIVKAIVEAHGGKVTADSVQGKGSLFTVVLPK